MASASQHGIQSAVALGVATARCASWLASQFHRRWCAAAPAKLHKKALHKVAASQSQSSFCGIHRWRALRVYAALFMQNCLRWSGRVSRLHSPAASRLTCSRLPPLCFPGALVSVRRYAHYSGQWPAAKYLVFAPPTPFALPASRHRRAGCPSAPRGGAPSEPRNDTRPDGGVPATPLRFHQGYLPRPPPPTSTGVARQPLCCIW